MMPAGHPGSQTRCTLVESFWDCGLWCGMGVMDVTAESLAGMFGEIFPHLDERQRRLVMGAQARALGHGGIRWSPGLPGSARPRSRWERPRLAGRGGAAGRARRPGAGPKRAQEKDPGLVPALLALVEPEERGDPVSPLRWTTKSTGSWRRS